MIGHGQNDGYDTEKIVVIPETFHFAQMANIFPLGYHIQLKKLTTLNV